MEWEIGERKQSEKLEIKRREKVKSESGVRKWSFCLCVLFLKNIY